MLLAYQGIRVKGKQPGKMGKNADLNQYAGNDVSRWSTGFSRLKPVLQRLLHLRAHSDGAQKKAVVTL